VESEVPAILAFVKFGSVKITAFLLATVLSVARNGLGGWIIKDLASSLHGPFTACASRVKLGGDPLWIA
jgi:hypothetical protein